MIKFLNLQAQYIEIKQEIDEAIEGVLSNSDFIGGPTLKNFENNFAAYLNANCCVGVGNGTDALEILLEAFNFPKGSEIIVPANSFIATSEAVTRAGFNVVFADIEPHNYVLDIEDVARRITEKTSAIIAVHLYGHPCDMVPLKQLSTPRGIKLIEDCAQAHGAKYNGMPVGTLGHGSAFSFYPGKNLGGYGDGGAIVTNNADISKRCRMIANHGRIEKYNHEFEGRNSRLDTLQAAILDVKLKHLDEWVLRRNKIAEVYFRGLSEIKEIELPIVNDNVTHAFHLFVIRLIKRDELRNFLLKENIQTGIHYPIALPKLKAYSYLQVDEGFAASRIDSELLSLPISDQLTIKEAKNVVHQINKFFRK